MLVVEETSTQRGAEDAESGMLIAMLQKYEPSGVMGIFSPVALVVLLPIAVAGAWLYQLLIDWIPFIYLNFIVAVGFGLVLAFPTMVALRLTKCRSRLAGMLIGLMVGAVGLAASHYFAYTAAAFGQVGVVAGQGGPAVSFSEYISQKTDAGWTIGRHGAGIGLTGFFVWLIWVIEGIGLLVLGIGGGLMAADSPFCEKCGCRANKKAGEFTVACVSPGTVERIRAADSVREMLADSGGGASTDTLKYTVTRCPMCDGLTTLEIEFETMVVKDKEKEKKTEVLHEGLLLSAGEAKVYIGRAK